MKVIYTLDSPKDVALAYLLYKTSPVPMKISISSFSVKDIYGWKKPKNIVSSFNEKDIANIKRNIGDDLVVCHSADELEKLWRDADVCISRGREFVVLKSKAKKNVALSLTGSYLGRLFDAMPYYNDNIRIVFFSEEWIKKGNLLEVKKEIDFNRLEKYKSCFEYGDIYGYYYDYMKGYGREKIKKELGIPEDKKVAFLSLRKAPKEVSIYKDSDEFMRSLKDTLKTFKDRGFFIVSRRRMGEHDMAYYKAMGSPEILRYNEVSQFIDKEMNDIGEFPYDVWKGIYCSDILLLMDVSGISYIEGAISRCPVFMPYDKKAINLKRNEFDPPIRDMIDRNLIFNEYNQENIDNYKMDIEVFLKKWYNYNIDEFWKKVLK